MDSTVDTRIRLTEDERVLLTLAGYTEEDSDCHFYDCKLARHWYTARASASDVRQYLADEYILKKVGR